MVFVLEDEPLELAIHRPLRALPEFAAHEQTLLGRKRVLVTVECPEIGELLPLVSRHLVDQRTLPVNHLIVGKRENEVLVIGVEHAERQVVLVERAVHRLVGEVLERVVHPPHVPLVSEAEPAGINRTGHAGECRGFFGNHHDARVLSVRHAVDLLEE